MKRENIIKTYSLGAVDEKEVRRYMGSDSKESKEEKELLASSLEEFEKVYSPKLCYMTFPISINGDEIDLGFTGVKSKALAKNLRDSSDVIVFAATLGIGVDRLIMKYSSVSPSRALCISAIGAERIEALCQAFSKEIEEKFILKPRFSPGYGDLKLEVQKDVFTCLSPEKKIGLTLNESFVMSPSKSVTAFIGIKKRD